MATAMATTAKGAGEGELYGLMAEFANPADLYHAAEKVRDAGFTKWDVYSPFPVHGMEEAMGLPAPKLSLLVALGGFTGASLGFLMQYYISAVDYPMVVQGKPYGAWEPFIPITFELGVLAAAFTAILGMLAFNKLPMWHHPLLKKERFLKVSDDRFVIVVEACDPKFDRAGVERMLGGAGAVSVEAVDE